MQRLTHLSKHILQLNNATALYPDFLFFVKYLTWKSIFRFTQNVLSICFSHSVVLLNFSDSKLISFTADHILFRLSRFHLHSLPTSYLPMSSNLADNLSVNSYQEISAHYNTDQLRNGKRPPDQMHITGKG